MNGWVECRVNVFDCPCLDLSCCLLGHGKQKNIHGHDDAGGKEPKVQAVHFPNPAKYEVSCQMEITAQTSYL